jgi:hypothetical protein
MHHCIGQELAAGADRGDAADRLFGLVPQSARWLFAHGCRRDPASAPRPDETTARPYFATYPVVLDPSS